MDTTVSRRKYNIGGCFTLVANLVAKADRPNPEQPVSLLQSWLPLSDKMPKNAFTTYRHPGVIPALSDRAYLRLAPSIDAYANERGWDVQPIIYFYRPTSLDDLLGEDGKINTLSAVMRPFPTEERILIDATIQTEAQSVMRDLIDMCIDVLDEANLYVPEYVQQSSSSRLVLNELLADMPFLVHHLFKRLPKLQVLRHRGRVNGRNDSIYHVRYSRDAIRDMDKDRLMRPHVINVAP